MQQLALGNTDQVRRQRTRRTYRQMLEVAMQRQNENFVALAQEFLSNPASEREPAMRRAMQAITRLVGGLEGHEA